jgi:haloacid dehalogenase superfamily, subfamily IA, variant 3 with third motif having DD or ED/haloacid dehalogenase superfamily, subfamily IA, variant 1 with third motif having Dx(3-4)D or Dx(3-4)E
MRNISAVIFDFGGVLVDWNPHYLYRKFFGDDPKITERFLQEIGFNEWNLQFDKGLPFADGVRKLIKRFPAYQELIRAFDERWEETVAGPIEQVVDILKTLKESGYPLYGLSNWSGEKFALVKNKYEFFQWFEFIILSGEEKLAKPDPRIFEVLLGKSGCAAAECLFVDDSVSNIAAAEELGFDTIHYQSPVKLRLELSRRGLLSAES